MTRPNIAFAIIVTNRFMHVLITIHMEVVYKILLYLKCNPGKCLLFTNKEGLRLKVYTGVETCTDIDWVGLISNRRSISSYYTVVGGKLVT